MGFAKDVRKERIQRRHFQATKSKQKKYWKSSTPMYADQCHQVLCKYAYYFYFIDEFSRKTWIYFMKNKDEVFIKFKEFKALIK